MSAQRLKLIWKYDPSIYAPAKYKRACEYEVLIPDRLADLELSLPAHIAGVASEAEAAIRDLNDRSRRTLAPLAHLLLRTESIASSKIEGMQLGVRELARAEARVEAGGKAASAALDILANISAMDLSVNEAAAVERFSVNDILAIHRQLMDRVPNRSMAGRLRTQQNWIGGNDYNPCGADFVPPPPEHVGDLLEDLCYAINDDALPPIVQAALVHAQFETIHPFVDGNGRTGRALIHVVLRRRGVAPGYVPPISVLFAAARQRYIDGLVAFRENRTSQWIDHFAGTAAAAAKLAYAYVRAVQHLSKRWRADLEEATTVPRADAAAWAIIEILPAHPIITAPVAAAVTERSKPSIYQAMRQLAEAGVLLPLSASRRNQAWEADGLLDLLAGMESGQLPDTGR